VIRLVTPLTHDTVTVKEGRLRGLIQSNALAWRSRPSSRFTGRPRRLYREDNFILEVKAIGGKLQADQYEQQHAVSVKEYSFGDFVDA